MRHNGPGNALNREQEQSETRVTARLAESGGDAAESGGDAAETGQDSIGAAAVNREDVEGANSQEPADAPNIGESDDDNGSQLYSLTLYVREGTAHFNPNTERNEMNLMVVMTSFNTESVGILQSQWNTHYRDAITHGFGLWLLLAGVEFVDTEALDLFIQFINNVGQTHLFLTLIGGPTTAGDPIIALQRLRRIGSLRSLGLDGDVAYEGYWDLLSPPGLLQLRDLQMTNLDKSEGLEEHVVRGLQFSQFQLQKLTLGGKAVDDARVGSLIEALSVSRSAQSLQELMFYYGSSHHDRHPTMDSFASLCRLLEAPFESLRTVCLNNIKRLFKPSSEESKECYTAFLNALKSNTNLQQLIIEDCGRPSAAYYIMLLEALTVNKNLRSLHLLHDNALAAVSKAIAACLPRITCLESLQFRLCRECHYLELEEAFRQNTSVVNLDLMEEGPLSPSMFSSLHRNRLLKRARSLLTSRSKQISWNNYGLCLEQIAEEACGFEHQFLHKDALFVFLTETSNHIS